MQFSNIPSPLLGLSLGIAGLGVLIETALPMNNMFFLLCCSISALLIILVITKFCVHPEIFRDEVHHPILGGMPAAGCMAAMLISKGLLFPCPFVSEIVWIIAVGLTLILPCIFMYYRIKELDITVICV